MKERTVAILRNDRVARDTYFLELDDPVTASAIVPGQFVMVRPASGSDPLLGRAFALYDVSRDSSGAATSFSVVYQVMGRGTDALRQRRPGDRLTVWGPLGHGFAPTPPRGPAWMVAGGVGQTPFLSLSKWWRGQAGYGEAGALPAPHSPETALFYGTRTADLLAGLDDFAGAGIPVSVATDDGSAGHKGYVTDLVRARLEAGERPARIIGCGPAPMLKVLSRIATEHGIPGVLSLENHMACGFGACYSCVAPIRMDDGSIDLRRVCVDGPVFDLDRVSW